MKTHQLCFICLFLTSCSSIDIQEVEPEKLLAEVSYTLTGNEVQLDVFLSRGLWQQPVELNGYYLKAEDINGLPFELVSARETGRYGLRISPTAPLDYLKLEGYPTIQLPALKPVSIGKNSDFEDKLFFKDDTLFLDFEETKASERYLIFTGYCGETVYQSIRKINSTSSSLQLKISDITNTINNSANVDLVGIIPLSVTLSEQYQVNWPAPFSPLILSSEDTVSFRVDINGFRLKAKVSLQLSNQLSVFLQSQHWETKYCY